MADGFAGVNERTEQGAASDAGTRVDVRHSLGTVCAALRSRTTLMHPCRAFVRRSPTARSHLEMRFRQGESVTALVASRSRFADSVLSLAWRRFGLEHDTRRALVAVGGYGRGELHPGSDIDLLILTRRALRRGEQDKVKSLPRVPLGYRSGGRKQCPHRQRVREPGATRRYRGDQPSGRPSRERIHRPVRADEGADGSEPNLVEPEVLRSQDGGAARAPSQVRRYRLQPRAQRQGRSRRSARHPDHRVGGETPFRCGDSRRAGRPRLPHRRRAPRAGSRTGGSCGGCGSRCTSSPGAPRIGSCSITSAIWPKCWVSRTKAAGSASNT